MDTDMTPMLIPTPDITDTDRFYDSHTSLAAMPTRESGNVMEVISCLP